MSMQEPTITQNSYSISKIKKLIDLNHDMINFKLTFNMVSENQFQALIIDQSTLDNIPSDQLEYKTVNGSLSGEVVADKNVYQNYYIILKSDVPTSVSVELQTIKLPDHINNEPKEKKDKSGTSSSVNSSNLKYILIGIGLVIGLYFLLCRNDKDIKGIKSNMNQSLLSKLKKIPLE